MGVSGRLYSDLNAFIIFISDSCPAQIVRKLTEVTDCLETIIEFGVILDIQSDYWFHIAFGRETIMADRVKCSFFT